MKRKIAVCDDDPLILEQFNTYFAELAKVTHDNYQIFYFQSGEDLIADMPRDTQIIFLDIELDKINGIEVASILRQEIDFYLVFITSKIEYALQGYEVHAFHFLRKPINYSATKRVMQEICQRIDQQDKAKITVKFNGRTDIIACDDIIYIDACSHDITFTLKNNKRHYTGTLKDFESRLASYGFFRCHNSYLINLKHIVSFTNNNIIMDNKDNIPLSKYRTKDFTNAFIAYEGQTI